jgi:hypothetical protein
MPQVQMAREMIFPRKGPLTPLAHRSLCRHSELGSNLGMVGDDVLLELAPV